MVVFLALMNPVLCGAGSTPPPIGENAYCGKNDVPKFEEKDGPAQLPKSCYYTGMDGTRSPGKQIPVGANSDLRAAVESAKCGDTLLLAAGASFEIKDLPAKKCDDQHYITIRTDTPDSKLPPEGTRISPAWAGVASLPGRPAFAQPPGGAAKLMPTLVVKGPSWAKIGDHYRFIGVEWVSEPGIRDGRMVATAGAVATTVAVILATTAAAALPALSTLPPQPPFHDPVRALMLGDSTMYTLVQAIRPWSRVNDVQLENGAIKGCGVTITNASLASTMALHSIVCWWR